MAHESAPTALRVAGIESTAVGFRRLTPAQAVPVALGGCIGGSPIALAVAVPVALGGSTGGSGSQKRKRNSVEICLDSLLNSKIFF